MFNNDLSEAIPAGSGGPLGAGAGTADAVIAPELRRENKVLVLGLGNPILGDDGVGVRIAEAIHDALVPAHAGSPWSLRTRGEREPFGRGRGDVGVDVSEACVGGLSLMERLVGYDEVILIDALCLESVTPGAVRRLSLDDLRTIGSTQHIASAHDTNLLTALDAGKRMSLPLPRKITLFAVEAENVLDFGESLTPEVARAIPVVVEAVLAELSRPPAGREAENGRCQDDLT